MGGGEERNLLLTLRFHGGSFHGSAVQKNARTVQGTLQDALEELMGEPLQLKCCSRTDAGVHARMFCVSFHTAKNLPCQRVVPALNVRLPDALAVTGCREVPPDFHARYSCKGKHYRYTILNAPVRDPFLSATAWRVARPLDAALLDGQARDFLGAHDFTSFCAAGGSAEDPVRTVTSCSVRREGELVLFDVCGDGFLYHMVRIMVGTLAAIGGGKLPPGSIPAILAARRRSAAGPTAPAQGLCLEEVFY